MKQVKIVIARLEPVHLGHQSLFQAATTDCDMLIIVLGSAERPVDIKNPWTDHQRTAMVSAMLESDPTIENVDGKTNRCATYFVGVHDYFYGDRDVRWLGEVRDKVNQVIGDEECEITLVGHHRDDSSYYLDKFPEWKQQEVDAGCGDLNATSIRESIFEHGKIPPNTLAPPTEKFIKHWMTTKAYENLRGDWFLARKIRRQDAKLNHRQSYCTADAVVFHQGCVLMIVRGKHPGKGLLALPGGYLEIEGKIDPVDRGTIDCAIRECKQETGLVLSLESCRCTPQFHGVFDHPNRSTRGRIISHAFKWVLTDPGDIPVYGADDAAKALWVPLNEIPRKYHMIFEDHAEIIEMMRDF